MRKMVLLLASVAVAMVVAGGVAWAATIQCRGAGNCFGTARADTMLGTARINAMYGYAGPDTLYGRDDIDYLWGQKGSDKLYGGPGVDRLVGEKGVDKLFGGPGADYLMPDKWFNHSVGYPADDYVHGGMGGDDISGHQATGGVDRIYGEDGNDDIHASQPYRSGVDIPVSKAIVDCGPGTADEVTFDQGVDVVIDNCEIKHPIE